jgi:hypothetical protein
MNPKPPFTTVDGVDAALRDKGFAVLEPSALAAMTNVPLDAMHAWEPLWNDLPRDAYLRDGGRYRQRRHASFVVRGDTVELAPRRAHYQPLDYNALHGGIERWFEPIDPRMTNDPAWSQLLRALATHAGVLRGRTGEPWFVEAHPFRITTDDGIGRPTPEGAHRDGVDLVAVVLVGRDGVKGGETRVFDADGPNGVRFTLVEPWSALLLDDARVIHESTPIQPIDPARVGHRDTLVITLRAGGFQSA